MEDKEIESLIKKQKDFFYSGKTYNVEFRKVWLKRLYEEIVKSEQEIYDALKKDLGKSSYESYMCEVGMVLSEITYMLKNVKKLSKEQRVKTSFSQVPAKCYKKPSPYGVVLVMSPWNYPFLLSIGPMVDALAAGNTVVLKPSAYSPNTSSVVSNIIKKVFNEEYVAVVEGGRKENAGLLKQDFNFVFFTGGQTVGKEVLRNTAEKLIPAVLELGGKSPCIIDKTANISVAAKRVVFGKYLNCGQTCIAPDYVLVDKTIKDEFLEKAIEEIKEQYGENAFNNVNYGKIINEKHFERISALIDKNKVVYGGEEKRESLQISPTIMDNVSELDAIMQEEIFGPILPILTFDNIDEVIRGLSNKPKPLALYLFSQDKENISKIKERCLFGGGCINDTIIHIATTEMGFGGVGESGMGSYHGKTGFETFSHYKSIVEKDTKIDLKIRYQPYGKNYESLVKRVLK